MKRRVLYVDTSVVLAELLSEDIRPDPQLWNEILFSSRLLEYEVWTRIHSKELTLSHGPDATQLLSRISFLELNPLVLARALEPFPMPIRTLDGLHLSSALFLQSKNISVSLATYDQGMIKVAKKIELSLADGF